MWLLKRRKKTSDYTIDDVTQRYHKIVSELTDRLRYTPLPERQRTKHFHEIKNLERDLLSLSIYANIVPDFFDEQHMNEIEGLLKGASDYLKQTGTDYNCLVRDGDRAREFKRMVEAGKHAYESMHPHDLIAA